MPGKKIHLNLCCKIPNACSGQVVERLQGNNVKQYNLYRFRLSTFEGSDDEFRFWTGFWHDFLRVNNSKM